MKNRFSNTIITQLYGSTKWLFICDLDKKKKKSYNSINQERKIILTFPLYQINLFSLITIMNFIMAVF
jgi:hypothetical protein